METKLSEVGRNSLPIAGVGFPPVGGKFEGEQWVAVLSLEGTGKSADVRFNSSVVSPGWFVSCEYHALSEMKS